MVRQYPPPFHGLRWAPQRLAAGPLAEVALAVMKALERPRRRRRSSFSTMPPAGRSISISAAPSAKSLRACRDLPDVGMPQPTRLQRRSRADAGRPKARRGRARGDAVAAALGMARRSSPAGRRWRCESWWTRRAAPAAIWIAPAPRREAAYHFMSAMAGNLAGFEEASRALFADDRRRFVGLDRRLARRYPRPRRQARLQRSHRAAVAATIRARRPAAG